MPQLPVWASSVLSPRWLRTGRRRKLGIATCAAVFAAGAGLYLYYWSAETGAPPSASVSPAALTLAPVIRPESQEAALTALRLQRSAQIDIAPVIADGGLYVHLLTDPIEGWLSGPATLLDDDDMTVVTRSLSQAGLAQIAGVLGTRLRLYRADGSSCLARVTGAIALARIAGDRRRHTLAPDQDPAGVLALSEAWGAWEGTAGMQIVAGSLEALEGSCDGALLARSDSLPTASFAPARKPSREVRRAAINALRALPGYRSAERNHRPGTPMIDSRTFEVATVSTRDETIVAATLVSRGCDGWWPIFGGLWRLEPDGQLRFAGPHFPWVGISTELLLGGDADGDGRLEFLIRHPDGGVGVLRPADGGYGPGRHREVMRSPIRANLSAACVRKMLADED